jgi:hypothetical protein
MMPIWFLEVRQTAAVGMANGENRDRGYLGAVASAEVLRDVEREAG